MSNRKRTLLATIIMTMSVVNANVLEPKKLKALDTFDQSTEEVDFDTYKVERNLVHVPISLADEDKIIARKGYMAIVEMPHAAQSVNKGSIVRNLINGKLSALSGNIKVLLQDGVTAQMLAMEYGLTVVANPIPEIALFSADSQDLVDVQASLAISKLVRESHIEVRDHLYETH